MRRLLLDTSAWSAMRRRDDRLRPSIQSASRILVTPVVIGELLFGFAGGKALRQNRQALREFLDSERVSVISVDEDTAERYASIRDHLLRAGTPVPANDLWIAASAAQHALTVLTLDAHFTRIPHILVEYFEPLA